MKIKKRFWVVFGYLVIVVLFYFAIIPISELIADIQYGDSETIIPWSYYLMAEIGYIPYIVFGFAIITACLSLFFYAIYRRRNKKELKKGFEITSIISVVLLVYLILEIIIIS